MQIEDLLAGNQKWAEDVLRTNPEFFDILKEGQKPKILWIGCSDSRVPPEKITGAEPGDIFIHRNIANQVHPVDINAMCVIQYAVEYLKVEHIIVCGHYHCGGVAAAIDDIDHGLIDNWLRSVQDINRVFGSLLDALDHDERLDKLCELNVREQVYNLGKLTILQNAWKQGPSPELHGMIFHLGTGKLVPVCMHIRDQPSLDELSKLRHTNALAI